MIEMIKNKPENLTEVSFPNDSLLSLWLKLEGWKGDYVRHNKPTNTFVKSNGEFIAEIRYNNEKLTRHVFIGENKINSYNFFLSL